VFADESWRVGDFTVPPRTTITDVSIVDVDRRNGPDLFVLLGTTGLAGRQPHLLMNDGHEHFRDETAQRLPQLTYNATKAAWGDLNGDHTRDVLISGFGNFPALLLLNDGQGPFRNASDQLPTMPPPVDGPAAVVGANVTLVDVDRNGTLDAVVSNENPFISRPDLGAQNWLWINDGHGYFRDETATRLPSYRDQTSGIVAADLTRDHYPDLIVINRGQKHILINDGYGNFRDETGSRFPVGTEASREGALATFQRGGERDLLVANSRHQPLTYYHNDGTGHFTQVPLGIAQNDDEVDSAVKAFELWGKPVFFVANAGSITTFGHDSPGGYSRFFVGDGHGTFTDETASYFPDLAKDPSFSLAVGDITGRGLPAVVLGNGSDQQPLPNGGYYLRLYVSHIEHC
jgi:hypothetical protein